MFGSVFKTSFLITLDADQVIKMKYSTKTKRKNQPCIFRQCKSKIKKETSKGIQNKLKFELLLIKIKLP